jgi:hypothetical protein
VALLPVLDPLVPPVAVLLAPVTAPLPPVPELPEAAELAPPVCALPDVLLAHPAASRSAMERALLK